MIIADRYEVPDNCIGCPYRDDTQELSQGGLCFRCPVMICTGDDPMVPPEDFREDWAEAFARWFTTNRVGYPELTLRGPDTHG